MSAAQMMPEPAQENSYLETLVTTIDNTFSSIANAANSIGGIAAPVEEFGQWVSSTIKKSTSLPNLSDIGANIGSWTSGLLSAGNSPVKSK